MSPSVWCPHYFPSYVDAVLPRVCWDRASRLCVPGDGAVCSEIFFTDPSTISCAVAVLFLCSWMMVALLTDVRYLHSESSSECHLPSGLVSFPPLFCRSVRAPFHSFHASLPGEGWIGQCSFVCLPFSSYWCCVRTWTMCRPSWDAMSERYRT